MRKNIIKTVIVGVLSGMACFIIPDGSYGNTPIAIYQQPFNLAVFFLMHFSVQSDLFYNHSMFDIRCKTTFNAKLFCFSHREFFSALYILSYFPVSCMVSYIISPDNTSLFFNPFSVMIWLISVCLDLTILNICSVNLNYLLKKNKIILFETAIILGGLALCFAAPNLVPYICIWFYGVYPEPAIDLPTAVAAYIVWAGAALFVGFIPTREILGKEQK